MNDSTSDLRVQGLLTSLLTGLRVGSSRPARPEKSELDAGIMRAWLAPLVLMALTLPASILMWIACIYYDGSVVELVAAGPADWWQHVPSPSWIALEIIVGWTVVQLLLLKLIPGRKFLGPVTPNGGQPEYKLNGVAAWVVTHVGLLGVAYPLGIVEPGRLFDHYGSILITLTVLAFTFCVFLYWKGRTHPTSRDTIYTGNLAFDFFQGIELHPRLMGVNLKQLINCRVSMMGWSVIFGCFLVAQYDRHGFVSTSMIASVAILVIHLFKFFWWEDGCSHTLDIMHDRFGYYICWGILVWVPSLYCLVALWLVDHPIQWHWAVAAAMVAFGILCIWLNYQADAQRQRVRDTGGQTKVWGKSPEIIQARYTTKDGEERESILLVSGSWGVARHFHYVPELALAAAWTVPAGFTHFLPWFYWIFLFILLMDRSVRDEKRCAKKYGSYWQQYTARVKWRVCPGLF